jgi:hypothetical protein
MRRCPALLTAVLLALLLPGHGASAGPRGSYAVHVLPDPTIDVSPYGGCRPAAGGWAAGQQIGVDAHRLAMRRAGVLRARLVAQANVFAGDLGLDWTLVVVDRAGKELARSSGPAWRTEVVAEVRRAQEVQLVACNRRGHPDATITWSAS